MSLDLINVGAEANDGTGDTPRAAFTKVNAAIAAINDLPEPTDFSGAISTLTTDVEALETSQGAQDTAISALVADVAALEAVPLPVDYSADIAALEVVQGSQAAAILALESDVADLQAAPASPSGWDYIGPTEPIGPAVGFTWWEKVAGATVGRWEWSGSLWLAINTQSISNAVSSSGSTVYPTISFEAPKCVFTNIRLSLNIVTNPGPPFNADNRREFFLARKTGLSVSAVFTFSPLVDRTLTDFYSQSLNVLNSSPAPFFGGTTTVGNPGTLGSPGLTIDFRAVR